MATRKTPKTNWKGSANLEVGELFGSFDIVEQHKAKLENRNEISTDYECLSNEIIFDGSYRMITKARGKISPT